MYSVERQGGVIEGEGERRINQRNEAAQRKRGGCGGRGER
jgi:hypothetical protein